jgi:hypothetical protein
MAKRDKLTAILLIGLVVIPNQALACSCMPMRSVTASYGEATAVFQGKVISRSLEPDRDNKGNPEAGYFVEHAAFVVERAWKGTRVGQVIRVRSHVGPGVCGISCRNDPPWMLDRPTKKGSLGVPAKISDEWLIFAEGQEPFEISMCTRSTPLNIWTAHEDIENLDRLIAGKHPL